VWDYAGVNTLRPGRGEELAMHPTVKPVALVAEAIKDCSKRGEIVLDPFAGSGTTLVAAEKTGRRARLVEFDPAYCDQIRATLRAGHRQAGQARGDRAELPGSGGGARLVVRDGGAGPPMTSPDKKPPADEHKVGYDKPPVHTRFRKGRSGNPGGRPRGMTAGRATELAIKEAYRPVTVKEGDKVITMPAIQAVMRSRVALAAKGNGPAQRSVIEGTQAIEREKNEAQIASSESPAAKTPARSELEIGRRPAFVLELIARGELKARLPDQETTANEHHAPPS
jgi:hypothetical protein